MTRDWEDDMEHPDGIHPSICRVCGETFLGFKRRQICYACVHGGNDDA